MSPKSERPVEAWKPQVSRLFGNEGFLIRWIQAYGGLNITRLGIHIAPVRDIAKVKNDYSFVPLPYMIHVPMFSGISIVG